MIYRILLFISAGLIALPSEGQFRFGLDFRRKNTEVCKNLENFSRLPELKGASWGLIIINSSDGKVLVEKSASENFIPASNMKILTSLNAFHYLGPDYRFKTEFRYSGTISDSVLNGHLWIAGSGDPTIATPGRDKLNAGFFPRIIRMLREKGIKIINGSLKPIPTDNPYRGIRSDWPWGDVSNYYGAGIYPLNINENQYHHYLSPVKEGDLPLLKSVDSLAWNMEFSDIQLKVKPEGSPDKSSFEWTPGSNLIRLNGSIPASKEAVRLRGSIQNPENLFLKVLEKELSKGGIQLLNLPLPDENPVKLGEVESPQLFQIAKEVNQNSNNFYTEALAYALCKNQDACAENGWSQLERINSVIPLPDGYYLADGSGLSLSNRISPSGLTKALSWSLKQKWSEQFLETLPVSGESGTMKTFCRRASGKIRAKSGTLNRTLCYSGFAETPKGKIIFSVMINNYHGPHKHMKEELGKILESFTTIR